MISVAEVKLAAILIGEEYAKAEEIIGFCSDRGMSEDDCIELYFKLKELKNIVASNAIDATDLERLAFRMELSMAQQPHGKEPAYA